MSAKPRQSNIDISMCKKCIHGYRNHTGPIGVFTLCNYLLSIQYRYRGSNHMQADDF